MTGTVIDPPFWGTVLGFALVMGFLFRGAMKDEARMEREQRERDARHMQRIPDAEIDHTYVSGGE